MTSVHSAKVLYFSQIDEFQNKKEYQYFYKQEDDFINSYFVTVAEFVEGEKTKESTVNIICGRAFIKNVVQFLFENGIAPMQIFDVLDDKSVKYKRL